MRRNGWSGCRGLRRSWEKHQFQICNKVLKGEQVGWVLRFSCRKGSVAPVRPVQDRGYLMYGQGCIFFFLRK